MSVVANKIKAIQIDANPLKFEPTKKYINFPTHPYCMVTGPLKSTGSTKRDYNFV